MLVAALVAAASLVSIPVASAAAHAKPHVKLTHKSAQPGAPLTARGSGYRRGARGWITIDRKRVARFHAGHAGRWKKTFKVPHVAPGYVRVKAGRAATRLRVIDPSSAASGGPVPTLTAPPGVGTGTAVVGGSMPPGSGPCGWRAPGAPAGAIQHVVWVVMENHSYSQIIGSAGTPYINGLANQCGLATNYKAITHPSLPNYVAMTSGGTQGVTDDAGPSSHPLTAPSIFSQVGSGNWGSLEESMTSKCLLSNSGQYAVKHNPAAYFTNIRPDCLTSDVPLGATPDIHTKFTFVTPNMCNDMHDCSTTTGDNWLKGFIPKLIASSQYQSGNTAIFLTWDEDDFTSVNKVATIVISPYTAAGTKSGAAFTHYSMLRTTEELLGINSYLGGAASAASMATAFGLR